MPNRQELRKNCTHSALINAAEHLFAEQGIYQVSIDEITSAANVGKGTFYNHFATRDDIVAAVVQKSLALLLSKLASISNNDSDILQWLINTHLEFFHANPRCLLILQQVRGLQKLVNSVENPVRREIEHYVDSIAELIGPFLRPLGFCTAQILICARFLSGAISGALSVELMVGEGVSLSSDALPMLTESLKMLSVLERKESPFADPPTGKNADFLVDKSSIEQNETVLAFELAAYDHRVLAPLEDAWSPKDFIAHGSRFSTELRQASDLESARQRLLAWVNSSQFNTSLEVQETDMLGRVIARDCARVWRALLHPRNEQVSGWSVLGALYDVISGKERPDLSAGFWAEIAHLSFGLSGRAGRTQSFFDASPSMPSALGHGVQAARLRSSQLDKMAAKVQKTMARYSSGLEDAVLFQRLQHRERILAELGANSDDWNDWRWHLRFVARSESELARFAYLSAGEVERIREATKRGMPFGVTPFYASLFDENGHGEDNRRDKALRAQVIPQERYLQALNQPNGCIFSDFMLEADTSPIPLITRRYAGVAILKPVQSCPQSCVYCQRNWEVVVSKTERAKVSKGKIAAAVAWLAEHPAIHEVLITGGDPFLLPDKELHALLQSIAAIPHIERIRFGTRLPVVLPMRFTPRLVRMLSSFRIPGRREICVVTHVQHSYELTPELVMAVDRLRCGGLSVYNQHVYTFYGSRRFEAAYLRRMLRRCGIDPYYTFYPKGKMETLDYRVPLARILQEQKEEARLLPGLARTDEPVYNLPGLGKNSLNAWQHRDLISLRPQGARVYEFHPWEKKIIPQHSYVGEDIPNLEYLDRLAGIGEDPADYESIWYYF